VKKQKTCLRELLKAIFRQNLQKSEKNLKTVQIRKIFVVFVRIYWSGVRATFFFVEWKIIKVTVSSIDSKLKLSAV
jgi:hypothetical protein